MINPLEQLINHYVHHSSQKKLGESLHLLIKNNHFTSQINQFKFVSSQINQCKISHNRRKKILRCNEKVQFNLHLLKNNKKKLEEIIEKLKPWHKGIFLIDDVEIDGHWDCFKKWQRLEKPLHHFLKSHTGNIRVLDVGSGNGYYLWQLKKTIESYPHIKSNLVLGIEKHLLYVMQFYLFFNLYKQAENDLSPYLLPFDDLGFENLLKENSEPLSSFDIVLSMGVLYHQKDPLTHLLRMKKFLKNNQSIFILETLITNDIKNQQPEVLFVEKSYCKMKNIWFIPNLAMLKRWLIRLKFKEIYVINISETTNSEQRKTPLSQNWSVEDVIFHKSGKTIEGLKSPVRVVIKALF